MQEEHINYLHTSIKALNGAENIYDSNYFELLPLFNGKCRQMHPVANSSKEALFSCV